MGGNALSHPSVRLTKKNYDRLVGDCLSTLRGQFPAGRFEAIESFRNKGDFGDADLVCWAPDYDPHALAAALGAVEVVRNGPVTSVGLLVRPEVQHVAGNLFQVDFIKQSPEDFDFALNYFKANDAGNLAGRLAKSMETSLRHDGLFFVMREGDYKFKDILLTRAYDKALAYIGLDAAVFKAGFDELTDIFEFIVSSPYFRAEIFLLENRNAASRVRDRKRPTYRAFLKYCEEHPELPNFQAPTDTNAWLPRIAEHFPHFQVEYVQALADLAELRAVKAKFNGEMVSALTGLQGKELGALMKRFKESFESQEALRMFVLATSCEDIKARVWQVMAGPSLSQNGLSLKTCFVSGGTTQNALNRRPLH